MKLFHVLPMSPSFRRGAAILAVCAVVAPVSTFAARPPRADRLVSTKQAVLRLSDVARLFGTGFTGSSAKPLRRPNGAAIDMLLHSTAFAKLAQEWVSGYSVEFDKSASLAGSLNVKSSVNRYTSSGTAQKTYEATFAARVALEKHAGGGAYTSTLTRYSGVGQYAELATNVMKPGRGGKPPAIPGAYQATITFTRGHYDASLQIVSATKINMSTALAAARIMDNRLRRG